MEPQNEIWMVKFRYDNKYFRFIKHRKEVSVNLAFLKGELNARHQCIKIFGHLPGFFIESIIKL